MFDVIILGGSYAGMSAALQLGRARRSVLVLDAGQRRNRFAAHAHGVLGQDGRPPEVIAAAGRADVVAYPSVTWRDTAATSARGEQDAFEVQAGDDSFRARRLILATGVVDELPAIDGLRDRWGSTVFHCPYCHGYELNRGRLGVIATHPLALHSAALVTEWAGPGQTTLFVNDAFEPDAAQLAEIDARRIQIERSRVVSIGGQAPAVTVHLADGRVVEQDGLFVMTRTNPAGPFAAQLGCALDESPVGTFYRTDAMKETTVPGVFACGDTALPMGALTFAMADGVRAGISAHQSLVFRPS